MSRVRVEALKARLLDLEWHVDDCKRELEAEVCALQKSCSHERYRAERDGDCHSPGYYYTCTHCDRTFTRRPTVGAIEQPR